METLHQHTHHPKWEKKHCTRPQGLHRPQVLNIQRNVQETPFILMAKIDTIHEKSHSWLDWDVLKLATENHLQ